MRTKSCRILTVIMVLVLVLSGIIPSIGTIAADTLRVAKILDLSGDVQVMKAGGEKAFKAFKGMSLTKGDKIITGQQAWALLEVGSDSEMKLAENTQLSITELAASLENNTENTSVSLWAGATYTNVKKKLSPGSKYEIKTPTAVMGVRGTQFITSHKNGMTVVTALSGEVTVTISQTVVDPDGTERQEHVEVVLQKDQQLTRSEEASQPADYNLDELKLEDLDLFILEVIQEVNLREPGLINPQILAGLDQMIEQKREEEKAKQQQSPPPPQNQQLIYEGDSGSDQGGSGDGTPPALEIAELTNISMTLGGTTTKSIVTSPQADTVNVSANPENIVTFSVMGNTLYINGYSLGSTTVTVTAQKAGYTSAARTFSVTVAEPVLEQVVVPTAYPEPGTYNEEIYVELATDTEGATIWYTTDGSNPITSGISYTDSIHISQSTTIKAYATKQGMTDSNVVEFEYIIELYGAMANPRIAENYHGYMVVYEKEIASERTGIFGRLIAENGVPYSEFAVSAEENGAKSPAIARDSEGNYLVVWSDYRGPGAAGIYGQFINSDGTFRGSNFLIDDTSDYNNYKPALAYDCSNSGYLVVWEEYEYLGQSQSEIYGRYVNEDGTISEERLALVQEDGYQYDPQIAYLYGAGKYLLAFTDSDDVKGQIINADGTVEGDMITIASAACDQMKPVVIADYSNDRFLVVWHDNRGSDREYDIYGQFVTVTDCGENLTETNFIINDAPGSQMNPAVVSAIMQEDMVYMIAWEDRQGEAPTTIRAQKLTAGGEAIGGPFTIVSSSKDSLKPAMSFNPEYNTFIAAYEDYSGEQAVISYQVFDGMGGVSPTDSPEDEDITVYNYATGDDCIRVDDWADGMYYKVYDTAEGDDLLGEGEACEGSAIINIEEGFPSSLEYVYISRTDGGGRESGRTEVDIPLPQLQEGVDFSIDNCENGYGRISFYVTSTQVEDLKYSLGLGSITVRAFVGKEEGSSITELPDIESSTVDVINITPDHPAGIGKKPGNYPYAVAVYDDDGNVLAKYINNTPTQTVESSFDSNYSTNAVYIDQNLTVIDPYIVLALEPSQSTTFSENIDVENITLGGSLINFTVEDVSIPEEVPDGYQGKMIVIRIAGSLTGEETPGEEGIIKISKDALSEAADNPSVDIYATVQVLPGEILS